jgi:hypothetical protein
MHPSKGDYGVLESYTAVGESAHGWNHDQSRLDGRSFRRKMLLILVNKESWTGIIFRKTMIPGTISLISVPEFEELTSMSLPPMRAVRSRMPVVRSARAFHYLQ